jgi:hypothetical protein
MRTSQHTKVSQFNGIFIRCVLFAAMIIQVLFSGLCYCVLLFKSTCCRKTKGQSLVILMVYLKRYIYSRPTNKYGGKMKVYHTFVQ